MAAEPEETEREPDDAEVEAEAEDRLPSDKGTKKGGGGGARGPGVRTFGIERYVVFGYMVAALIIFWLLGKIIPIAWGKISELGNFEEPNDTITTIVAAVAGIAVAYYLYKRESTRKLAQEVASELSKVTWPTRKETSSATVVVLVTSLIAAVYLFFWDTIWSAFTDFVYQF